MILVSVAAFWLVNYVKRWALISRERTIATQTQQEIAEYKKLGFSDQTELIQLLEGRLQRTQARIDMIMHTWLVLQLRKEPNELTKRTLDSIASINKKMLLCYIKDVKDSQKLGVANADIIKFAHDKIIRLTIGLSEVERQLKSGVFCSPHECSQRLSRMHEINQESITQFKRELHALSTGLQENDPKLVFVRNQITQKMRALCQLEEIIMAY